MTPHLAILPMTSTTNEPRVIKAARARPYRSFIYCDTEPTVLVDLPAGGLFVVNDQSINTNDLPLVIGEGDLFAWIPGAEA